MRNGDAPDAARLRASLRRTGLDTADHADDPLVQFAHWREEGAGLGDETAVLATVGRRRHPSARCVDVVRVDRGFVFFTNHGSRKGVELALNPRAALCFDWHGIGRQVQAGGEVHQLTEVESDTYFGTMPRPVQLLVWASDQSRPVPGRDAVRDRLQDAEHRFAGQEIPRSRHWGGYRLVPDEMEFWQERADRVPDRFRYRRAGQDQPWEFEWLAP